jgi:Tol biopolymer transport system component
MPSISRDGQRLVFRSRTYAVNPVSIPFDPAGLRAGTPLPISNANTILLPSDISPDGRLLAYQSLDSQEDILVGGLDGSDLRRITDDAARDRRPVWTPDGRSLVFYSNRDGQFEVWRVGRDGGNRQKIGGTPDENVVYPLLSPQGDRVAVTLPGNRQVAIGSMTAPFNLRTLDGTMMTAGPLYALSWSGDGSKLAGVIVGQGGPTCVAVYDLASGAARVVSDDAARAVRWLSDSRRVLYFTLQSQLVVLDTSTLQRTVIDVRLPLPPASVSMFALSRDDRTIIYGGQRAESDIWIMENR